MPLPRGPHSDPEKHRLYQALEAHMDERPGVEVLGVSDSGIGSDVTLTFRANRHTPYVYVHVQSDNAGEGGESYDADNRASRTRYNTVSQKQHTVTISRDDDAHYYAYVVPTVQIPPGCGTDTLYDGVAGDDHMAFADLGKRTTGTAELEDLVVTAEKLASDAVEADKVLDGAVVASKLSESGRGFVTDVSFNPDGSDAVDWGSGTLVLSDGTSHSIGSGSTGSMSDPTYVYFDPTVSTTAFQTTTTLADATGDRRVLVGVAGAAADSSQEAAFVSAREVSLNEEHLSVNSVTANVIAAAAVTTAKLEAGAVTAEEIQVGTLDGSQNLLSQDAGPEHSGTAQLFHNYINGSAEGDLDAFGLAPGDVVSMSVDAKSDTGADEVGLYLEFRDSSDTYISDVRARVAASSYTRAKNENIEIPANTAWIKVIGLNDGQTETGFARRAMLTKGPIALSFHEPPFRIQRETIDEISGQILEGQVSTDAITETKIEDGAIVTGKLAAGAVTAAKVEANTITASEIAGDTITASEIDADAITASELAADSVEAGKIAAGAINATDLFVDGVVEADKMNVGELSTITANVGVLTAGRIEEDASTPTRGMLISGSVPGDWTRFLNLADASEPFLEHENLTLRQDGSADFSGEVSADNFTADTITQGDTATEALVLRTSLDVGGGDLVPAIEFYEDGGNGSRIYGEGTGIFAQTQAGGAGPEIRMDTTGLVLTARTAPLDLSGTPINVNSPMHLNNGGSIGSGLARPVVHHGTGSASSIGVEGAIHTEDDSAIYRELSDGSMQVLVSSGGA